MKRPLRDGSTSLLVCVIFAVIGLTLSPSLMAPAFSTLLPVLGGMTVLVVELAFALIIDMPLAFCASAIACRAVRGARASTGAGVGALFLLVFVVLIVSRMTLTRFGLSLGSAALREQTSRAVSTAIQATGFGVFASTMALYTLADFVLCSAAGIVGFHASALLGRKAG